VKLGGITLPNPETFNDPWEPAGVLVEMADHSQSHRHASRTGVRITWQIGWPWLTAAQKDLIRSLWALAISTPLEFQPYDSDLVYLVRAFGPCPCPAETWDDQTMYKPSMTLKQENP